MSDLFSLMIPAAASAATGWLTKRILDAVAGCPKCGQHHEGTISNGATNSLVCTSCQTKLDQYAVATPTTVLNGRIMSANIFRPHWEPKTKGFFVKETVAQWFLMDISTVGMQHHGMIIKAHLKDAAFGKEWALTDLYLNNSTERSTHMRQGWQINPTLFKHGSQMIMDVKVFNTAGDVLHHIAPITRFSNT